jgi:hypothetical protein
MLGGYDLERYKNTPFALFATPLYILYTVLVTVLLFNVLTARMTHTIEHIKDSSRHVWIIERARIMRAIVDEYKGGWDELLERGLVKKYWQNVEDPTGLLDDKGEKKLNKFLEVHLTDESYYTAAVEETVRPPAQEQDRSVTPTPPVPSGSPVQPTNGLRPSSRMRGIFSS